MVLLENLLTPVAALLHIPVGIVMFAAFLLTGVIGHYAIYRVVRRLTTAADNTDTRWDDVLLYAIFPPIQWVMWVVLALLSISLFPVLDGIREAIMRPSIAFIILAGLRTTECGIEEELLGEHRVFPVQRSRHYQRSRVVALCSGRLPAS